MGFAALNPSYSTGSQPTLRSDPKIISKVENEPDPSSARIYENASDAPRSIKVILFFTTDELRRVKAILKKLKLDSQKSIVLIDARRKVSASKADDDSE